MLYIDCTEEGGLILGDNPRSVLLAVYEYLRKNGCAWIYPGVDGEYIPTKKIIPVKLKHVPTCRYRGNCIEGAVKQDMLNDYVDFLPKVGLNTFMLQFRIPSTFYKRYYNGTNNEKNHKAEPISDDMTVAYTRLTECEMAKRGIMLHSCGHGWTVDPFGIDSRLAWTVLDDSEVKESTRQYLAMLDGKRALFGGKPANTQFCMSNKCAREKVVKYIADYAENHSNTDYLHVWLADASNNHCECEECVKKLPSDWYMVFMNELDRELTERRLPTRIVFIVYLDTTWAPTVDKITNPDRFTMMLAPITRDYSKTIGATHRPIEKVPFVRNKLPRPASLEEYMLYVKDWQEIFSGSTVCFEYHFWKHMNFDSSGITLAKRIYEDNIAYRAAGIGGIIECGTQRSFFPNGLAFYTHARSLFDGTLPFETIVEEYLRGAYGESWQTFRDYFLKVNEVVSFEYVEQSMQRGFKSEEMSRRLEMVKELTDEAQRLARGYDGVELTRPERVSLKLLDYHREYIGYFAEILKAKAKGDTEAALDAAEKLKENFGKNEEAIFPYHDVYQSGYANKLISNKPDSDYFED
jgi:hypothetical protein